MFQALCSYVSENIAIGNQMFGYILKYNYYME